MQQLFSPAVWLANRLSYPVKFVVASLLIVLATSLLFFRFYTTQSSDIAVARNELAGLSQIRNLLPAIQYLQQHRGLSSGVLGGNTDLRERTARTSEQVDEFLARTRDSLPPALLQSAEWRSIMGAWTEIREKGLDWPKAKNFELHTELIGNLLLFLGELAQGHQLILDASGGSFYLIDSIVDRLPQALEPLGQIRAIGMDMLAGREVSYMDRINLSRAVGEVQGNIRLLQVNLRKVLDYHPHLQETLRVHGAETARATAAIAQLVSSDIVSGRFQTAPVAYFDQVTVAIDTGYELAYRTLLPHLENLLTARVREMQRYLYAQAAAIGLLLLAVGYFFAGISLSMTMNVRSLAGNLARFSKGDFATRADLTCRDELRQLADGFNSMAEAVARNAAELDDARRAAVDAAQAKTAFLSNMSHEIRTPMNAVISLSHVLLKSDLSDQQSRHVNTILDSGEHLLGIINDVLDLSKIEAGKYAIDSEDFKLEQVRHLLHSLIAPRAEEKGLALVVWIDPAIPEVIHGDGFRLKQILLNFAGNAVKFTEKGRLVLQVTMIERGDATVTLRFEMRDTGIGLASEQQSRLFSAFEQADTSTTRRFGGSGLGLAISKRLAELMGGTIGVMSTQGEGSAFWVELPFRLVAREAANDAENAASEAHMVLVAMGGAVARARLAETLAGMGIEVRLAENGEAVAAAAAAQLREGAAFDALVIDRSLPGADGELYRRIVGLGYDAQSVVLIGAPAADGRAEVLPTGLACTLDRDTPVSELLDAVLAVLAKQHAAARRQRLLESPDVRDLSALNGRRVLLVDDNQVNQEIGMELLAGTGVHVDLAGNGAEAVEKVKAGSYDLILMDVQMPVMDGLAATRAIRALPSHAGVPILAMTANAFVEDREACLAAGMNDHIAKPIVPERLHESLIRWLPAPLPTAERPLPQAAATEATSASDDEIQAVLREIDDFDPEIGLCSVRGRMSSYMRLLGMFAERNAATAADMEDLLAEGRGDDARRLAHSLRGAAGSIGAVRVQALSTTIEHALKSGSPDGVSSSDAARAELRVALPALTTRLLEICAVYAAAAEKPAA